MKTKYTPGPWTFSPGFDRNPSIVGVNGTVVCVPCGAADARLIAAAPELLEALENALEQFQPKECNCDGEYVDGRIVGHACYFHRIEDELRAAIAKATGGAE